MGENDSPPKVDLVLYLVILKVQVSDTVGAQQSGSLKEDSFSPPLELRANENILFLRLFSLDLKIFTLMELRYKRGLFFLNLYCSITGGVMRLLLR